MYFRGMKLEYLPPYSPDFNPIELAFSLIKSRLRREGFQPDDIYDRLYAHVYCISSDDCHSFFCHCRYIL